VGYRHGDLGNPFAGLRAPNVLQNGLAASERALKIGAKTERERDYINAVHLLYRDNDTLDHRARTLAYEKAMEQIYKKYPKDLEAAAFYALAVDQTAQPTDKTFANQLKAPRFRTALQSRAGPSGDPHLIHSYDVPPLCRAAVRRYADRP
jgi:hypothetical protein